jgi:hypothetical protein
MALARWVNRKFVGRAYVYYNKDRNSFGDKEDATTFLTQHEAAQAAEGTAVVYSA